MGKSLQHVGFRDRRKVNRILRPVGDKYGDIRTSRSSLEEAVALLEAAADASPREWILWYTLGDLYEPLGDFVKSVRAGEKCYELRPSDPRSAYALATNLRTLTHAKYVGQETYVEARRKLHEQLAPRGYVAAFDPDKSREALQELGMTLDQAAHRSLTLFVQVLSLGVPEAEAMQVRECLKVMSSEFPHLVSGARPTRDPEAQSVMGTLGPREAAERSQAHFLRAVSLRESGALPRAIEQFQNAILLRPDFYEAHWFLAETYNDQGALDRAIEEYRESTRLRPDSPDPRLGLGTALRRKGLVEEAIACYRDALRWNPGHALLHNCLAIALHQGGDLDEAIAEFRETLRLAPGYAEAPQIYACFGPALHEKGLFHEAIRAYEKVLRVELDDPDIRRDIHRYLALATQGIPLQHDDIW
jgi:tetratricopeptide (TPR) repeat protein